MKYFIFLSILPVIFLNAQNKTLKLSQCDELIRQNPNDTSNYYERALLNFDLGEFSNAVKDLDVVVLANPKNITALYKRSLAKAEIRDISGAILDLNTLISYDSNNSNYFLKRSVLNAVHGNTNLACQDARRASSLGSVDASSIISMLCK